MSALFLIKTKWQDVFYYIRPHELISKQIVNCYTAGQEIQHLFCRNTGFHPKNSLPAVQRGVLQPWFWGNLVSTKKWMAILVTKSTVSKLQGRGHHFLINSVQQRKRKTCPLPRYHRLNSGSVSHHSNLSVWPEPLPGRLLASVIHSVKCMFNFPKDHFLSIGKASYIWFEIQNTLTCSAASLLTL